MPKAITSATRIMPIVSLHMRGLFFRCKLRRDPDDGGAAGAVAAARAAVNDRADLVLELPAAAADGLDRKAGAARDLLERRALRLAPAQEGEDVLRLALGDDRDRFRRRDAGRPRGLRRRQRQRAEQRQVEDVVARAAHFSPRAVAAELLRLHPGERRAVGGHATSRSK